MQNYGKKIFGLVMDSFRESRPGIVSVQDRMIIIKVIIVVSSNETFLRNFKHFKCFFAYVFFLLHQMAITLYSYWRFGYTIAFLCTLSDGMYYIDYVGFATCSQLFWELCW